MKKIVEIQAGDDIIKILLTNKDTANDIETKLKKKLKDTEWEEGGNSKQTVQ